MAITYELDSDSQLVRTTCTGVIGLDDVLVHFQRLERDTRIDSKLNVLLDLSQCESPPESDQVRSIVAGMERLQSRFSWGACAIVATDDVMFGMGRVYGAFASELFTESQVFRDMHDADAWLSLTMKEGG